MKSRDHTPLTPLPEKRDLIFFAKRERPPLDLFDDLGGRNPPRSVIDNYVLYSDTYFLSRCNRIPKKHALCSKLKVLKIGEEMGLAGKG